MRPVATSPACPLGFSERDLPPGAELPPAWRTPRPEGRRSPVPSRRRESPAPASPTAHPPGPLQATATLEAYNLWSSPARRREAAAEEATARCTAQLEPLIFACLALGVAITCRDGSLPQVASAATLGAALALGAHQVLGRGPRLRRGARRLAEGRFAAAEAATAWSPGSGAGLLQLAECRRRQEKWAQAANALVRLQPEDHAELEAWTLQLEAVAARHAGPLADFAQRFSTPTDDDVDDAPSAPPTTTRPPCAIVAERSR